jgi:hypothetical protein
MQKLLGRLVIGLAEIRDGNLVMVPELDEA